MTEPLVGCVMLTKNRTKMAQRAVRCFQNQTYGMKALLIWDTGELNQDFQVDDGSKTQPIWHIPAEAYTDRKIGGLRNDANGWWHHSAGVNPDILIHWDDDDWSHPNRIAEQVALLQESGANAVGYREMLFWKTRLQDFPTVTMETGEAWLYRNNDPRYCIGTSLCYWRTTWEEKPFRDDFPLNNQATGEDNEWQRDLKRKTESSLARVDLPLGPNRGYGPNPRMIASIHGRNTASYHGIEKNESWTRVPEWDAHCRKVMEL